jgi:hypothetical protein
VSDLTEMQSGMLEVLTALGSTCTYIAVTPTYADGEVTETTVSTTIIASDPVGDRQDYVAGDTTQRVTGSLYMAYGQIASAPKLGDRITYQTRTFHVTAIDPYRMGGGIVGYHLDLAEIGA